MWIASAVALFANLASGIGVVLANKLVFTLGKFRFPTALTALHYLTNTVFLLVVAKMVPSASIPVASDASLLQAITVVWALHNALSNHSLAANSIGLYQISKILVTPMIVMLEYAVYRRLPNWRLAIPLVGACVGVALATVSDVSFEASGALLALLSCGCSSVLKVMQQHLLQQSGLTSLQLMHKTWAAQTALLLLSTPLLDPSVAGLLHYHLTPKRSGLLLLSCLAAFALNLSSLSAIKLTSAVVLVLLSQGKTVTTLLLGYLFFDGHPSSMQLAGSTLAVVSLGAYTYGSLVLVRSSSSSGRSAERGPSGSSAPLSTASDAPSSSSLEADDDELEQQPLRRTT